MHPLTVVLFFVLLIAPVGGAEINESIFDAFNVTVFTGELETGDVNFEGCNRSYTELWNREWYPGHYKVPSKYISAAINITGYRGVALVNGVECVSGCPSDLAIISQRVTTDYAGFEANKDWVKRDITIVSAGGNTTATMVVTFMWHWTTHSSVTGANKKHYRIESKTVRDIQPHPKVISENIEHDVSAYVTHYNYSRAPITYIDVIAPDTVIKIVYTYNNTSIIKYSSLGVVNDAHVAFVNDSAVWEASPNQTIMTRQGDRVIIRTERFNSSKLNITLHTPYSMTCVDNMTTNIIEPTPARIPLLVRIFGTLGTLAFGLFYILGAVTRRF